MNTSITTSITTSINNDVEKVSKNNILEDKINRINDILEKKISKMSIIEIMKNQLFIMNFIKQNITHEIKILLYLEWIIKSIIKICQDTNTPFSIHKKKYNSTIVRSSYYFCSKKHECHNNDCTYHHFVFHLLYADVNSLYDYIKKKELTYDLKEVIKSINTIIFVMNHMTHELLNRC